MIRHHLDISRLGPGLLVCMALLHGELPAAEWLQRGEVEFGAGYVFDDEYRFGRYNGLTDDGAVAVLNADVQRRREEMAAQEKERQHQRQIQVVRQKLARLDRQIASIQELLKDEYSWTRDRDLAKAKELATERAQIVEELARLGEEP